MRFAFENQGRWNLPRWLAAAGVILVMTLSGAALADEPGKSSAELEEMIRELQEQLRELTEGRDEELEELKQKLDELEAELREETEAADDDDLAAILAEAEAETAEEKHKESAAEKERENFEGRQRTLQAMNPEVSFVGDFSYDWAESEEVRDQFTIRAAEIAFQAPLDPHTRFKGFVSAHQHPAELEIHDEDGEEEHEEHGAGEISVTLEEAYMEWVALPLGTNIMVGKFRQQFGTLNRWHPHALPSVETPFALRNTFGEEGLNGVGFGARWLFPEAANTTTSLELQVTNGDNEVIFAGGEFRDPSYLLRPAAFVDIGPASYFEIGLTAMTGPNNEEDDRTDIGGVDVNFLWEPVQRARYRNVELRGEFIHSSFEQTDEATGMQDAIRASSWYLYASGRVSRRWIVGLRYDDSELPSPRWPLIDPADFREGLRERAWTPFVTFWQSEFVRLRFQYQHATRNFVGLQGPMDDQRAWIQVTWAAGPHKHEEY